MTPQDSIRITVNGDVRDMPAGSHVRHLVEALGLGDQPVAVEVNRELTPRAAHEATTLRHGDEVEIVTLVGGG